MGWIVKTSANGHRVGYVNSAGKNVWLDDCESLMEAFTTLKCYIDLIGETPYDGCEAKIELMNI